MDEALHELSEALLNLGAEIDDADLDSEKCYLLWNQVYDMEDSLAAIRSILRET